MDIKKVNHQTTIEFIEQLAQLLGDAYDEALRECYERPINNY